MYLKPGMLEKISSAFALFRVANEAFLDEAETFRSDDVRWIVDGYFGVGADVEEGGHGCEVVIGRFACENLQTNTTHGPDV